jgi:hypothetical protein
VVTISGAGFSSGATVTIGGGAATGVNVASPTSVNATTPTHAVGTADVTVTNPDSQSGTCIACFMFGEPAVSGTVKDGASAPVAGASVQAYQAGAGAVCCTWMGGRISDSSGNYSFTVPAGTYRIWINPPAPFPQPVA